MALLLLGSTFVGGIIYFINWIMGFLNELWNNQPNILIGVGGATLVLLGIYIKLLDIYQWRLIHKGGAWFLVFVQLFVCYLFNAEIRKIYSHK